jgi:hypothetical protein
LKVLLLCGYRNTPFRSDRLDDRISELKAFGLEPVVVISGARSDELLRSSRFLPDCELVYDTNENVSIFTNVKAGLQAVDQACFVHPVDMVAPPRSLWIGLKRAWQKQGHMGPFHLFQSVDKLGTLCHSGFPLLISGSGRNLLLRTEDITGLTDPRLKFHHEAEPLAPTDQPF